MRIRGLPSSRLVGSTTRRGPLGVAALLPEGSQGAPRTALPRSQAVGLGRLAAVAEIQRYPAGRDLVAGLVEGEHPIDRRHRLLTLGTWGPVSRNKPAQKLSGNWSPESTGTRSSGGPLWNRTRSRTACLVTMPDTTPSWRLPPPPAKVTRNGLIPEDWVPRPPPPPWSIRAVAQHTCCRLVGGGLAAMSQTLPWALAQRRTREVPRHPRTRLVTSRTMPPGSGPGYGPGCALTLSG